MKHTANFGFWALLAAMMLSPMVAHGGSGVPGVQPLKMVGPSSAVTLSTTYQSLTGGGDVLKTVEI